MRSLTALHDALEFLLPSFALYLLVTVAIGATASLVLRVRFARQFEMGFIFGTVAYVLGMFIGTAGASATSSAVAAVMGTVSTLLSAILTYWLSNKAKPEMQKSLVSASFTFLIVLLLTVFYLRSYFGE